MSAFGLCLATADCPLLFDATPENPILEEGTFN
jgi:hypothetical protein